MTPSTDEWSILIHPNSGRKYFYNIKTGESRWNLQNIGGPYSYNRDHLLTINSAHKNTARQKRYHSLNDGFDKNVPTYNRPGQLSFMTPPRERPSSFPGQYPPPKQTLSAEIRHRETHTIKQPNLMATHDARDQKHIRSASNSMLPMPESGVVSITQSSATKSKPENYNKDYLALSKEYHLMERFRANPYSSNADLECNPICVVCKRGSKRLKVLFPCEHVCVCGSCLESSLSKRCPVCNEMIRIAFDHDGNAHENYMRWVEEVKPSISTKFLQQFFAESKDTIKREIMKGHRSPRRIDDFDLIPEKAEHETSHYRRNSSGIFSCWQWLIGRRASACAPG